MWSLEVETFFKLFSRFKVNENALVSQTSVAKNLFKSENVESPLNFYNCLMKIKSLFPDLFVLFYLQLVFLIPVSSSKSETSLSSLKRITTPFFPPMVKFL